MIKSSVSLCNWRKGQQRSSISKNKMDGVSVGVGIFVTVGLIIFSLVTCCAVCCCCCAIPIFRILGNMFFPKSTASQQRPGSSREYELVNSSNIESGSQHGIAYAAATSAQEDIVLAEAYIVPPLAEVVNADPAVSGQDSNRIHELQELTTENKDGGFRDRWAALLFIINVGIIVYLFVQSFYMLRFPASDETNAEKTESNYDFGLIKVIVAFAVLLTTFAAASGSWILSFLMQHAENLIEMVMWGNIAIQGTCAVLCLLTLQLLGAIIFAIFAGLNYWYLISVRDQIPFSSTVLATACTAVKANYTGLVTTAFSALFVQMVWALLWTVAFIGVMYASSEEKDAQTKRTPTVTPVDHSQHGSHDDFHTTDDTDDGAQQNGVPAFYLFLLFVSLYWGIQVIKAVVQTTVAGTLACWWFQPKREAPVRGSLFRALTTSFDSLCFGSLIVALIQALREMLQLLKRQMQRSDGRSHNVLAGCVLAIVDVLMGWIDQAVQYFNKYAYCYVAAYGLDFISSGRLVSSLFYNRGWTAIINDNLISRALFCGVVAMTVANMVVGVLLSLLFDLVLAHSAHEVGTLALIGGLVGAVSGLIVGIVLTNALDSAVAMVYVCFAESPKALQENHPEVYTELRSKWESLHPHTLAWWTGSDRTAHPSVRAVPTQPIPVAAPRPAAASVYHAPHSVYQPPNAGSPYNPYAASPGYNAYGGYSGYGGYGAAGSVGAQQSSPSSAVYDPNYNAALYAHQVGRTAGPSAVANPMHGVDGGKHLPPPSAPPGY